MDSFFVGAKRNTNQPDVGAAARRFGRGGGGSGGRRDPSKPASIDRPCSVFVRGGVCRFGDQCRFSHSVPARASGLQVASFRGGAGARGGSGVDGNDKRKAGVPKRNVGKLCKNFVSGACTFGGECRFSHGNDDSAAPTNKLKRLCRTFQKDSSCKWGDRCKFVHNTTALAKIKGKAAAAATDHPSKTPSWPGLGNFRQPEEVRDGVFSDSNRDSSDSNDSTNSNHKRNHAAGSSGTAPRIVATVEDLDHAAALAAAVPVQSGGSSSEDSSDYSSSDDDSGEEVSMRDRLRQRRERVDNSHFDGDRLGTWDDAKALRSSSRYDRDLHDDNDDNESHYEGSAYGASYASSGDEDEDRGGGARQRGSKNTKKKKPRNRAPAEMSSKKAVTRYRVVVPNSEVSSIRKRDPRFDTLSGKLNRGHWETAYGFIDEYKKSEIRDMRKTAKKAKTVDERDRIQAVLSKEVNRVAERERWKSRREIVQSHRRNERNAIAQGTKKNPYFMKRKDLKRKELEIKFDSLKKDGRLGKFMEKRRKKNSQKDRKRMPRNFS